MTLEVLAPQAPSPRILEEAKHWIRPAMRSAADRLHPDPQQIGRFAFGWREDGVPLPGSGGKGVRPALAGLGAVAAGGAPEDAVPGAVAVEFAHAFSLVHDDIMDGDDLRRHRATVWKAYGRVRRSSPETDYWLSPWSASPRHRNGRRSGG